MSNDDLSKLKIDKAQFTASPIRKGRRTRYFLGAAALLVLVALLYVTGIIRPSTKVEVATVAFIYPSQTFTVLNASGYVVPQRKAAVASKITGRLVSLSVEEGSTVTEGQVIARLESDDVTAQRAQAAAQLEVARFSLDQAKAELNDATLDFQREKDLVAQEFTTKSSYDAAEARYRKGLAAVAAAEAGINAYKAALREAEVALDYTLIRAPFDAVVLTKNADIGDIVTPIGAAANAKAAVVTIADMDSLLVEADVSESSIKQVSVGGPCEIQLDALPDKRLRGAIHMIVPTADRTKATVMVKVRFIDKDSRILPEMSAKVAFLSREPTPQEEKPRIAINPKALREKNGATVVFLVQEDRAIETPVTVGAPLGDFIEVTGGVKAEEKVVLNPPKALCSGSRITIAEK
jgi:RND family efflux transporter MFP subunit